MMTAGCANPGDVGSSSSEIVYGTPDGDGHPEAAGIVLEFDGFAFPYCSGVLIAPRVVLTAAHCALELQEFEVDYGLTYEVTFDGEPDYSQFGTGAFPSVTQIIPHPDFVAPPPGESWIAENDLAVLVLDRAAGVRPARLTRPRYLDRLERQCRLTADTFFTVVGYGASFTDTPPDIAFYDIRQTAESTFLQNHPDGHMLILSQDHEADPRVGGTCVGDSGGPVYYVDRHGREILVALSSGGDEACLIDSKTQRLDLPSVSRWIRQQVRAFRDRGHDDDDDDDDD